MEISFQKIDGIHPVNALVDTGSEDNFICADVEKRLKIKIKPLASPESVSLACSSSTSKIDGYCCLNLEVEGRKYSDICLKVLDNLVTDMILGIKFMKQHQTVSFVFEGKQEELLIHGDGKALSNNISGNHDQTTCNLTAMNVTPPSLFTNLAPDCKPIATRSRRYNQSDKLFIKKTVKIVIYT